MSILFPTNTMGGTLVVPCSSLYFLMYRCSSGTHWNHGIGTGVLSITCPKTEQNEWQVVCFFSRRYSIPKVTTIEIRLPSERRSSMILRWKCKETKETTKHDREYGWHTSGRCGEMQLAKRTTCTLLERNKQEKHLCVGNSAVSDVRNLLVLHEKDN